MLGKINCHRMYPILRSGHKGGLQASRLTATLELPTLRGLPSPPGGGGVPQPLGAGISPQLFSSQQRRVTPQPPARGLSRTGTDMAPYPPPVAWHMWAPEEGEQGK